MGSLSTSTAMSSSTFSSWYTAFTQQAGGSNNPSGITQQDLDARVASGTAGSVAMYLDSTDPTTGKTYFQDLAGSNGILTQAELLSAKLPSGNMLIQESSDSTTTESQSAFDSWFSSFVDQAGGSNNPAGITQQDVTARIAAGVAGDYQTPFANYLNSTDPTTGKTYFQDLAGSNGVLTAAELEGDDFSNGTPMFNITTTSTGTTTSSTSSSSSSSTSSSSGSSATSKLINQLLPLAFIAMLEHGNNNNSDSTPIAENNLSFNPMWNMAINNPQQNDIYGMGGNNFLSDNPWLNGPDAGNVMPSSNNAYNDNPYESPETFDSENTPTISYNNDPQDANFGLPSLDSSLSSALFGGSLGGL